MRICIVHTDAFRDGDTCPYRKRSNGSEGHGEFFSPPVANGPFRATRNASYSFDGQVFAGAFQEQFLFSIREYDSFIFKRLSYISILSYAYTKPAAPEWGGGFRCSDLFGCSDELVLRAVRFSVGILCGDAEVILGVWLETGNVGGCTDLLVAGFR